MQAERLLDALEDEHIPAVRIQMVKQALRATRRSTITEFYERYAKIGSGAKLVRDAMLKEEIA